MNKTAYQILFELAWPSGAFGKLGRALGVLSVVALIQYGFEYGLSTTIKIIIKYYDNLVEALLGWTTPFVSLLLNIINEYFQWELTLYPYWKHIFVLLNIYFFRAAAINYSYGYRSSGIFAFLWGALVAFVSSILAGSIEMNSGDISTNMVIAAIPVIGIFLYDLPKQLWDATFTRKRVATIYRSQELGWWVFLRPNLYLVATQMIWSVLLVLITVQIPWVHDVASPSLVIL